MASHSELTLILAFENFLYWPKSAFWSESRQSETLRPFWESVEVLFVTFREDGNYILFSELSNFDLSLCCIQQGPFWELVEVWQSGRMEVTLFLWAQLIQQDWGPHVKGWVLNFICHVTLPNLISESQGLPEMTHLLSAETIIDH